MKRPGADSVRVAILSAVVSVSSYLCGRTFTALFHGASAVVGGLWSLITVVIVLQQTRRDTLDSAWKRLFGTLTGAVLSGVYLSILPYSLIGMAACIGVTVLAGHALGAPDHARLAAITVAIVMVTAGVNPDLAPALDATLRFAESAIGAGVTIVAVHLWPEALPRR